MDNFTVVPENHYREAAEFIRQRIPTPPSIGLILGSGLGSLVETITDPVIISYSEIPHWPQASVKGHVGRLAIGQLESQTIIVMQGRVHFYEGHSMQQVTLPVRVMRLLGVNTLILTNAAGGLNPNFEAGDIMVIEDHIFLPGMAGNTPLRGPNLGAFGPRFSINTRTYHPALRKLAHRIARELGYTLREGVYVSLAGPAFETPAEVRMLRLWGGDTVGMSTAHEAQVAYHAGMRVLGFSLVTNLSLDSTEAHDEVSHEEVLRLGQQAVPRLAAIIQGVLRAMPRYDPAEMENQPEEDVH